LQNEQIEPPAYFAPFACQLLAVLATAPLTLVIDGSQVGLGGMALVIAVVYKGRALPIGWLVVSAKKGHLLQSLHIQLLKQVKPLVPEAAEVVFLGDGEFDGCRLLKRLQHYGGYYVCRTAENSQVRLEDQHYSLRKMHRIMIQQPIYSRRHLMDLKMQLEKRSEVY